MKLRESYERCRTQGPSAMAGLKKELEESKISHRSNSKTTEIVADTNKDQILQLLEQTGSNLSDVAFSLFVREQREKTYIRLRYH